MMPGYRSSAVGMFARAAAGVATSTASWALAVCITSGVVASAQQLIGYVNTRDAEVTGASDVMDGRAVLTISAAVAARDHTAPITLGRGGSVRVCQTSKLRVTESRSLSMAAPLLFSLDRGAIEIQMAGTLNDSIMTPDLRFTIVNAGPLDLRLRVAGNGDTCVENRGTAAPTLAISDAFGETMYQVMAGQHVLFEHGNLHEVVDHERTPCGCPDERGMSVADALLASGGSKSLGAPAPTAPPPTLTVTPAPLVSAPRAAVSGPAIPAPIVAPVPAAARPVPAPASALRAQVAAPSPAQIPAPAFAARPGTAAPASVAPAYAAPAPSHTPVAASVAPARAASTPAASTASAAVASVARETAPSQSDIEAANLESEEQKAAQAAVRAAETQAATQSAAQAATLAAEAHPFPAAISEGLAPVPEVPQAPQGQVHAQVSDTLSYNAGEAAPASAAGGAPAAAPVRASTAPPAAPRSHHPLHAVGRFFRWILMR